MVQAHGSLTTYFHRGTLKRIFDKLWGYKILQGAANVIAITETEAGQYQSMGVSEDKIEIVPNGIDLSEFENLPQRGEFRRKYGLGNSEKMILYLGRIHKTKGLNMLLKAFHKLCEELEKIKLVIAIRGRKGPFHWSPL
jgi:glycosyltransferase involved in cell wall biosynthesis